MDAVLDFLWAALPWIAMGLLLAVFAVKSAGKKKKEEPAANCMTEGMCLGMCLGTAVGTSLGNVGTGISLGMLIGLAVGSCIKKEERGKDNDRKE